MFAAVMLLTLIDAIFHPSYPLFYVMFLVAVAVAVSIASKRELDRESRR
jgi:hypothetical protein